MRRRLGDNIFINRDPVTLGVIAVGIAGVGTGASLYQSSQARKEQKSAAESQQRRQQEQLTKLEDEQAKRESGTEATRVRDMAAQRQRQQAASATGRRSTILTSPLGLSGETTTGRKTLLGQ